MELLSHGFLEDNLALLDLAGPTLELVRAATPEGRVELLRDRTPVLRSRGQLLGMPSPSAVDPSPDGVTVVFGLGLGDTVRTLREGGDRPVVVYEPDAAVLRTVLELGPTDLGGVEVVCTLHDLARVWPELARGRATATLVRTPGYPEAFPEAERALVSAIEDLVQRTSINSNTYRVRAREWIRYTIENIGVLAERPSFLALSGKYPGVPVFVVGAGPSLGKNGELLARAAEKGIVIAVNTSARALASYGVEPQMVACIESIDVSHLLRDVPYMDRVVRAFSLSANPNTLSMPGGPLLPVYEGLPQISTPLRDLTSGTGLAVCGSVSTLAFSLAQRLGATPIVLVGQDLAYTGGKAYAKGTAYEASTVRISEGGAHLELDWCDTLRKTHDAAGTAMHDREPLTEVLAWGGQGMVPSGPAFSFVRSWFEDAARVLARDLPGLRLVNATEGGARISGFEETTLAAVLEGMPDRHITAQSIADTALVEGATPRERIATWARAQAALTRAVAGSARRVGRLAARAEAAVDRGHPGRVSRAFGALEQAERALTEAVSRAPFVDAWACAAIGNTMDGAGALDAHESTRRERAVARVIEESAAELGMALESVAVRFG